MILESISGVRGLTSSSLTSSAVRKYVAAFHQYCEPGALFVGRDSRATGDTLQDVVIQELSFFGRDVFVCDIVPTPTIQFMVEHTEAAGGIVITASHNPSDWNGLKFIRSDGIFLFPEDCDTLFQTAKSSNQPTKETVPSGMILREPNAVQKHIIHQTCLSCIDLNSIREKNFKAVKKIKGL